MAVIDVSRHDLSRDPAAVRAMKLATPVSVAFAEAEGTLQTAEGPVRYRPGDALLTGALGDRWPVSRERFLATYEPVAPAAPGDSGQYRKCPVIILARRMSEPFSLRVGEAGDAIRGEPGDWWVQYAPGKAGIVSDHVFQTTYRLLSDNDRG